jgi:hypothetical protein
MLRVLLEIAGLLVALLFMALLLPFLCLGAMIVDPP